MPTRTKIIIGAVGLGLVLALILVLLPGCGGKGVLLVEEPVLAAQGGSIGTSDGKITLEIPSGALTEDTTVSIRVLSEDEWTDDIKDLNPVGPVYSLEPDGLTFQKPVTVKLALDSSLYSVGPDGIEVTAPLLYTTDTNGQPEPLQDTETVVSPEEAYIQGNITHFSPVWERKGTVKLVMVPPDIDLSPQSFFTAFFLVSNLRASRLEEGQEEVNLRFVILTPMSVLLVKDDENIVEFALPSGKHHTETVYYYCYERTGSYGAVIYYAMSPVDKPTFEISSSIVIWGTATCLSAQETTTPPTTTTPTPPATPPLSIAVKKKGAVNLIMTPPAIDLSPQSFFHSPVPSGELCFSHVCAKAKTS